MSYRPITDTWILARPKVKGFYGCYPSGFLARARALLGVGIETPVLHVCAGRVRDYQFEGFGLNDKTLDLDPETNPDFLMDAREVGLKNGRCEPSPEPIFGREHWPAILIDRPYTEDDLKHYASCVQGKLPNLNKLLKDCLSIVQPGGQVGVLDYFVPRPPKNGVKFTALVSVLCGYGNRMRAYSVFERRPVRTEEQKRRTRLAITGKRA